MRRFWIIASVLLAGYLVTGFYVVRGNEKVAVYRFGRVVRTPEGRVSLAGSGLALRAPVALFGDRANQSERSTDAVNRHDRDR